MVVASDALRRFKMRWCYQLRRCWAWCCIKACAESDGDYYTESGVESRFESELTTTPVNTGSAERCFQREPGSDSFEEGGMGSEKSERVENVMVKNEMKKSVANNAKVSAKNGYKSPMHEKVSSESFDEDGMESDKSEHVENAMAKKKREKSLPNNVKAPTKNGDSSPVHEKVSPVGKKSPAASPSKEEEKEKFAVRRTAKSPVHRSNSKSPTKKSQTKSATKKTPAKCPAKKVGTKSLVKKATAKSPVKKTARNPSPVKVDNKSPKKSTCKQMKVISCKKNKKSVAKMAKKK